MNSEIWFSNYKNVNDPFELYSLSLDENENYGNEKIDNDIAKKIYEDYIDGVKSRMLFSCFSTFNIYSYKS